MEDWSLAVPGKVWQFIEVSRSLIYSLAGWEGGEGVSIFAQVHEITASHRPVAKVANSLGWQKREADDWNCLPITE